MKIFRINEQEWYMAETIEQAVDAAKKDETEIDRPKELSSSQMANNTYVTDDSEEITFTERMSELLENGNAEAQFFATTEY